MSCNAAAVMPAPTFARLTESSDIAIRVEKLSKCYQIYDQPRDRLKQFVLPRLQRAVGVQPKQYFREFWALKDVSFEVNKGETVGIIGRNGSGKSTLLQMICGTLNPTSGKIQTQGRVAALLELGSGFNPEFTGRENVYLNAAVLGLGQEEIDARFGDIAAFADIGEFIEQPLQTYSSGMMVRLAFAVIANVDADILVVDEALAVGDVFFTQKCMRFLRQFMQKGTVLFVSHDTNSIKSLCTHAIWMENGRILQAGAPKDVCEKYLEALYETRNRGGNQSSSGVLEHSEPLPEKDQRLDFINSTNLRNDVEIFQFDATSASFGKGGAHIVDVRLLDRSKHDLRWVVGGETVILSITASVHHRLHCPIIGFFVKDRLGQALFGDNTYLTYRESPVDCLEGSDIKAEFVFDMPLLPIGRYSVTVAIANGTQDTHDLHHWIHDALVFESESSSVATGLIGIPMLRIGLSCV